jgi:hypothetical protein
LRQKANLAASPEHRHPLASVGSDPLGRPVLC